MSSKDIPPRTNVPVIALASAVLLLIVVILVLSLTPSERTGTPVFVTVVGLVVSTVPSLIAAAFAERVSKDVRNGTLVQKTKQATHEALQEAGVVTHDAPTAKPVPESDDDADETEREDT